MANSVFALALSAFWLLGAVLGSENGVLHSVIFLAASLICKAIEEGKAN